MTHEFRDRYFVSVPESLVDRPVVYELVKGFEVVPNIRRANVEAASGWMIMELAGENDEVERAVAWLGEVGCEVNRMEGDVLEG